MIRSYTLAILVGTHCLLASIASGAIHYNGNVTNTNQILSATNSPYFAFGQIDVVGVNFEWGSQVGSGSTLNGIEFDNIDLDPNSSPYALVANGGGKSLTVSGISFAGRERSQSLNAAGPDDTVLETVANQKYYITGSETVTMTVSGLSTERDLLVQVIGGDSGAAWTGNFQVTANGNLVGDWNTVTDEDITTASLFTFDTTSSSTGTLTLVFSHFGGSYASISGFMISEAVLPPPPAPEPSSLLLLGMGAMGFIRCFRKPSKQ